MKKKYIWETITVSESQTITSDCADIYFWNKGKVNVKINGVELQPNDSMSDGAWGDEMNVTLYQILFSSPTSALLVVKRKKYAL